MTMRTKTLTAVAALSIFAGGYALAQEDAITAPAEIEAPAEAEATTPLVAEPTAEGGAAEEQPAEIVGEEPMVNEVIPVAEGEEPAADTTAVESPAEEAAEPVVEVEAVEEPAVDEAVTEEVAAEAALAEGEVSEEGGEEESEHIEDIDFSFEGPFGTYDQFQLQRGLQVYTEVCAACHGMKFVPIRTLGDAGGPGLPEDQVRAYAQNLTIIDTETGEERPREPTDHFPTISGLGTGPDLSLMAKARAGFEGPAGTGINQLFKGIGGPEYIHAILTSYTGEEKTQAGTTLYGNKAFEGGFISMPPPLFEELVTYEDGTPATVDQMARDVSAFLMWTAEPKLMARKQVGLVAVVFLIVLTVLLYMTNKKLWAPHKNKKV